MERSIFMIGTALESRSGIAAVVNVYRANGLFRRAPVRYVPTHVDGAASAKLAVAARAGLRFLYEAARGRVALLHIHGSCGASFWRKALFAAAARALGVPYVFHLHGGRFPAFYARDCGALGRACVRAVLRAAEAVAVLSDEWRREVSAVEPAARVVVLPNPISVPRWRATLDGEVPTVLFLGVLREAKGVLELVQAWPRVLAAVPGARLVLGGSGDLAAVSAAVRAAGVESSVEFPGWVGGAEKERLLRNAWVLALPSHWEAQPMSVLEAMAAGVPVVASAVGAIPRAVEHGRSGLLIAPRDPQALAQALISLLTDGEQRKAMGANARRRAEECFSADALVPQLEALWRRVGRARADFPIPFKGRSGSS